MKNILLTLVCLLACVGCQNTGAAPVDYQYAPGASATEARQEWYKLTKGEELARGKKVLFSIKPNYHLTTDANDPYDLTDGKLSSREDDRIWFNKDAVGWARWGNHADYASGIVMTIDLGSIQPIGQIAIRMLGGLENDNMVFPKQVEFLASRDGEQYYSLQNMAKLNYAERDQADNKTSYYVPEEGKPAMTPIVCRVPVQARYIAIRVTPISSLYVDQISVLKADASQGMTDLSSYPKAQFFTDGLALTPRQEPFVVTTNITTPNWFIIHDNSNIDPGKNRLSFRIELPKGFRILPVSNPKFKEIPSTHSGMNAYVFNYDGKNRNGSVGPIWVIKDAAATIAPDAKVLLTGIIEGKDSHQLQYPIELKKIPETSPIAGLDVSLAWMNETQQMAWPNFLRDFRKMGFNDISTFPRYYSKNADGNWNESSQQQIDFVKAAKAQGYGVVYNESPASQMWNPIQRDLKAGKIDDATLAQIFNQIDGKRGKWMNILYRGKYFQDEIKRVAERATLVQPDQVYLDIEWWTQSVKESKKDPRVQAAWKASGKSWEDFITDIGTEVLGDLVSAIRNAVPEKKVTVGLYHLDPQHPVQDSIFQWNKVYPHILDIAMPELYIQGRTLVVRNIIRGNYDTLKTKSIIPWLSTGTYGEYDPQLTEPMVLESILNGARGITYYSFSDFDPMDYYYHAKAIQQLKPYEHLLQEGKPIPYKADNADLYYTAFASSNEALILVGNYGDSRRTKVLLPSPFKSTAKVLLQGEPLDVTENHVTVEVPPGEFRWVYFQG